ncbi:MAG TPA: hypothetical protein VHQ90_02155 [Thermoanaerobaculia bacterium]|nr:hypothetical protein [Thermoanaerobaculia bacterium]
MEKVDQLLKLPRGLKPEQLGMLQTIVWQRRPHLTSLVDSLSRVHPSTDQIDELREALLEEFLERGLDENHEPNKFGLAIDDLIGSLGNLRSQPENP